MKMKDEILKLTIGGLLHDVGKVVYRTGKGNYHGDLGADFIRETLKHEEESVLNQVRYHHISKLEKAGLKEDDLAYITYIADNISAFTDRRMYESDVERELQGRRLRYERGLALQSIFNVLQLKKNKSGMVAQEYLMTKNILEKNIRNLTAKEKYTYDFYKDIHQSMVEDFKEIEWNAEYVNSIVAIMEKYYSYIPSSTFTKEIADVSLYAHSKLTAAYGCCIYEYLQQCSENGESYKQLFVKKSKEFYEKEVFLYYSFDISGIQDFIYTIHSDGALKNLRARSFYLEILVEHIADEILERLGLSRVNLLYTGGGHAQFILANTKETEETLCTLEQEINQWLRSRFDVKLYFAGASCKCCANDFSGGEKNQLNTKLEELQRKIQKKKMRRYTAKDLEILNDNKVLGERECKVCHHSCEVNEKGECKLCESFRRISRDILEPTLVHDSSHEEERLIWKNKEIFLVVKEDENIVSTEEKGVFALPLPWKNQLYFLSKEDFDKKYQKKHYVRVYSKNDILLRCRMGTHLWVGDYNRYNTLKENAEQALGIKRIGVLRADVDNLSDILINGFEKKHNTLSRRTALSEQLSIFFKYYINEILSKSIVRLKEKKEEKRAITVVYSGGDDVFLIGSWDDVIGFAIDLHNALTEFSEGKLTISAGVGIYPEKFPVSQMAYQVGALEDCAKREGKNAITLFSEEYTFTWETFIYDIYEIKYKTIAQFFSETDERGISFLYHLLELLIKRLKSKKNDINLARYAFLLARLEPSGSDSEEKKNAYKKFANKMYEWARDTEETKETIVAIYLYLYIERKKKNDRAEEGKQ